MNSGQVYLSRLQQVDLQGQLLTSKSCAAQGVTVSLSRLCNVTLGSCAQETPTFYGTPLIVCFNLASGERGFRFVVEAVFGQKLQFWGHQEVAVLVLLAIDFSQIELSWQ